MAAKFHIRALVEDVPREGPSCLVVHRTSPEMVMRCLFPAVSGLLACPPDPLTSGQPAQKNYRPKETLRRMLSARLPQVGFQEEVARESVCTEYGHEDGWCSVLMGPMRLKIP